MSFYSNNSYGKGKISGQQSHYSLTDYFMKKKGVILPNFGKININPPYIVTDVDTLPIRVSVNLTSNSHVDREILLNTLFFGVIYSESILTTVKENYE